MHVFTLIKLVGSYIAFAAVLTGAMPTEQQLSKIVPRTDSQGDKNSVPSNICRADCEADGSSRCIWNRCRKRCGVSCAPGTHCVKVYSTVSGRVLDGYCMTPLAYCYGFVGLIYTSNPQRMNDPAVCS